jgi:hypothetical protein
MTDSDQIINKIPEYAKSFIKVVRDRCGKELDFSDASIAKLDEVLNAWQNLSQDEKSDVLDEMSYYFGEIIRRNLGGGWVDPKWNNPKEINEQCYLKKVGGTLTIHPHNEVKKLFCHGHSGTFSLYYNAIKQKAKSIKKDSYKNLEKGNSAYVSTSPSSRFSGVDRTISILTIMQFLSVILGWVIYRKLSQGYYDFLSSYGYVLVLIPMIWAPLMIYANSSTRTPEIFDRILALVGYLSIFFILGLFGWRIIGAIDSFGSMI